MKEVIIAKLQHILSERFNQHILDDTVREYLRYRLSSSDLRLRNTIIVN